jgi:BirA family biotin operon repressor/biotin-[acetyl-CoA-carboxylase] ligase
MLIMADIQTGGRGRLNERVWQSPFGNFHGSFIIDIGKSIRRNATAVLNGICLKAIRDTIVGISSKAMVDIKKPNDIMIADKKVAGVLIEVVFPYAVIGIGINTKVTPLETATNLHEEFGIDISNRELAIAVYEAIVEGISSI